MAMRDYTVREAAVKLMTEMCGDPKFGYHLGEVNYSSTPVDIDIYGRIVRVPRSDYDCGSSIRRVYELLGANINGADKTANMKERMCSGNGSFRFVDWKDETYDMRPGDIALYVNPDYDGETRFGHAAMCVDEGYALAEFFPRTGSNNELLFNDTEVGDQGGESRIRPYYNYTGSVDWRYGWTWCLIPKDDFANQFWSRYDEETGEQSGYDGVYAGAQAVLNEKLALFGLAQVAVTGAYDLQTQNGLVRLLQASNNHDYQHGLTVDGYIGNTTVASMNAQPVGVGHWVAGNDVWVVKAMLVGNGYPLDLTHWEFGDAEVAALNNFKLRSNLVADGLCNGATLLALAPLVATATSTGGTIPGGGTSGGGNVENLVCDGWWGSATTAALQRCYGTPVDGEVWGQWQPNVSANTALTSGWICDAYGSGSALIRKLQEDLGTAVDGVFGGPDILAFQARCGQAQTGALIGPDPSVAVMQQRLNAGTWLSS